ncbi:hypothetical protein B0A50_08734 [Salinomyces thailandicus]|uniref:Uncharacterized protein n=1 Tax=Salinomyces thailandicus TaxID=706561 RepID=A0A4U0TJK4_9PEZI|nr:hypothetical protein B0A50_08734 [Salinomyces thailandica]
MPRWLTPRRILVYGAYLAGVFSILVGLFIGKHAWRLHATIKLIERSWDHRNISYENASWIDKAAHAITAGHEDVSQYNDLYWEKIRQLEEHGEFDRTNLTKREDCRPEWAEANESYEKWGFVLYRTHYGDDWDEKLQTLNNSIRAHLEVEATEDGQECDPRLVRDRATLEIVDDRELLEDATPTQVRALWRKRVDDDLVDSAMKIGGWRYGWFRMRLPGGQAPNGIPLNMCLMYDFVADGLFMLQNNGVPATGPRDPWEPFLVVVDGLWDAEKYMYITSWAEGYQGTYGVALSLLMNSFHGAVYEREPERSAPYMSFGASYIDSCLPLWRQLLKGFYGRYAVARPGRFPFHDRYLDMKYPFVREDSHWGVQEQPDTEPAKAKQDHQDSTGTDRFESPVVYSLCLDSDDPADCFQMGNLRVRKPGHTSNAEEEDEERDTAVQPKVAEETLDAVMVDDGENIEATEVASNEV